MTLNIDEVFSVDHFEDVVSGGYYYSGTRETKRIYASISDGVQRVCILFPFYSFCENSSR